MNIEEPKSAVMFPGQGSQHKGMAADLFDDYRSLADQASALLGYSVVELCLKDPHGVLSHTQYTQPALYVVNALCHMRFMESGQAAPDYFIGHSLGEYNALLAAGAFDFQTGLQLVRRRGELMAAAENGGMCAVLGMSSSDIEKVLSDHPELDLSIANFNSPVQTVLSGNREHIQLARSIFEKAGARSCVPLNVTGAFHSGQMEEARANYAQFIESIPFQRLKGNVVSNVTAELYKDEEIRSCLSNHFVRPVKWYQSVSYLHKQGVHSYTEVGPGRVLGKLVADITRGVAGDQKKISIQKYEPVTAAKPVGTSPSEIRSFSQKREFQNREIKNRFDNTKTLRALVDGIEENYHALPAFTQKQKLQRSVSYGDLKNQVSVLGTALLALGIRKGDRVGLLAENRIEWPMAYLAIACVGAVVVPVDVFLSQEELENVVRGSEISACLCSPLYLERLARMGDTAPRLNTLICFDNISGPAPEGYTLATAVNSDAGRKVFRLADLMAEGERALNSGSLDYLQSCPDGSDTLALIFMTGNQFAELSHQGVMANVFGTLDVLCEGGKYLLPGEKSLVALPFHHTFPTMGGFLLPLARHMQVYIVQRFSAKQFVTLVQDEAIEYAVVVPFMLETVNRELDKNKANLDSIKFIFTGGASVRRNLLEAMLSKGCNVVQGFGLTEFSPIVTVNSPRHNRLGSIGKPIANVEIRIADPDANGHGELLVRGPSLMKGYAGLREETARAIVDHSWLRTGDIACLDSAGYLYISGRSKPIVVNSGGKNIYLGEVEALLRQDKCVADIKLFPYIDAKDGECPAALIYPDYEQLKNVERETKHRISLQDLPAFFLSRFDEIAPDTASYKIPKRIFTVAADGSLPDDLPFSPDGKRKFMFLDHYLNGPGVPDVGDAASENTRSTAGIGASLDRPYSSEQKIIAQFIQSEINRLFKDEPLENDIPTLNDLDSITQLTLKFNVEQKLNVKIPMALLAQATSLNMLAETLAGDRRYVEIRDAILATEKARSTGSGEKSTDKHLFFRFIRGELDLNAVSSAGLDTIYHHLKENHNLFGKTG